MQIVVHLDGTQDMYAIQMLTFIPKTNRDIVELTATPIFIVRRYRNDI